MILSEVAADGADFYRFTHTVRAVLDVGSHN
jgi:hypothetical protein